LKNIFIFDACALIALLAAEDGSEKVRDLILDAIDGNILLKMNQVNLLEVYYYLCNVYNQDKANKAMEKIKKFPIEIINGLSEVKFKEAGRIKSIYKIPLGDSIAVAECIVEKGTLVTSDHNDFEKILKKEIIKINWFR
jgi:predicted nucleic acid-binding protein